MKISGISTWERRASLRRGIEKYTSTQIVVHPERWVILRDELKEPEPKQSVVWVVEDVQGERTI